jgi:hypothetical protein
MLSTDDSRSPLARDAKVLMTRVVDAIAEARAKRRRSVELVGQSHERVVWSDMLVGRSTLIRDRLRETVTTLASFERAKGEPPERMVVLLKGIVAEAEGEKLDWADAQSLLDDVVRWGIEAYYAA